MHTAWQIPSHPLRERQEAHQLSLDRLQTKKEIIAHLIGGRIGLLQAARQFQMLVGEEAQDEVQERYCREVIGWAHLALCDRPERAEALSERLEIELQFYLCGQDNLTRIPRA